MKKCLLIILVAHVCWSVCAQTNAPTAEDKYQQFKANADKQFTAFNNKTKAQYSKFRENVNKQYADFLRNVWLVFEPQAPIVAPKDDTIPPIIFEQPEPVEPKADTVPRDTSAIFVPQSLPVVEVITNPAPLPQPQPIEPIVQNNKVKYEKILPLTLYGTDVIVHIPQKKVRLDNVSQREIADAWQRLADKDFDNLLADCLQARDELKLCDWAYLSLLQIVAQTLCGQTNAATLLQGYLYIQSGYKMRFATVNDSRLVLLIASQFVIYNHPYFDIDGEKYFAFEPVDGDVMICPAAYQGEQPMSLLIYEEPELAFSKSEQRKLVDKSGLQTEVCVNTNLLELYDSYPSGQYGDIFGSRWAVYANAPFDELVKTALYPPLKQAISGKSDYEAANILLNYVQTAFVYEYDNVVWGDDRAFFAEETLFYPYSDCEDRSILFSRLVRDLLGLKVVLVYYPNHLAAAVRFNSAVQGDYVIVDDQRYTIADPTYIGAPIGNTMQGKDNQSAVVIKLD